VKSYHGMQTSCMLMCDDKADFFSAVYYFEIHYTYSTLFSFDESSKTEEREILQFFGLLSHFVARNRKLIIYSFFSARRRHTCLQLQWDVTSVVEFTLLHICHCMQKQICNHFFESDYISEIWCRIFWHPLKSIFSRGCQRCIFVQQRALKYLNLN
jgi:hypothetical protein